jgi:tetratricopeptide (TPR) repeat protein
MKNFLNPVLHIFLISLTIETTYAQLQSDLQKADSFYMNKNWTTAKLKYLNYLGDTSKNSMIWNRLGFCNQNLGLYSEAISDYNRSLAYNSIPQVKGSAMSRMAMVYMIPAKRYRLLMI